MIQKLMRKYAVSEKGAKDLIYAVLAGICVDLALMLPVGLLYLLVEDMLADAPFRHLPWMMIGCVLALVLIGLSALWQYNATFFAMYRESGNKRIALAEKLRKLPLSFFGKRDSADLTTVILGDVAALEHSLSHQFSQFYAAIFSTLLMAIGLFFFNWKLSLAAFWMLPISVAIVFGSKQIQHRLSRAQIQARLKTADGIQEYLETSKDLKSANAERTYLDRLSSDIDTAENLSVKAELSTGLIVNSAQMLLKFGIATVALVGGNLLLKGEIDVITFFCFLLVVSRVYEPLNASLINLAALNALELNVDRMNEITDCPEQTGAEQLTNEGYDIVFDHVGFSYNAEETVLKDVSFTAKQGEVTALVGPSGGGKTTVSRLAARFWDPTGGTVTVGGMDITKVDPETLLQLYSIVFQDVTLFDNTIMENIRVGAKDATDEEVIAAAKMANVDEFVKDLPQGYQTVIGENGSELSGGERQRISIARAFLKDAPIILLDEATASLDAENETKVQSALSALIKNKTVLLIAHRMRTVAEADKIVVLKDGKAEEQGRPEELYRQNGIYTRMADLQSASGTWNV
ncbi:MAG TPA: ABC transporter ATP-binding protein [Clostridiales bacterium]|nr:ABC transporter ATP-binding protein [Clostridiales bacterium]